MGGGQRSSSQPEIKIGNNVSIEQGCHFTSGGTLTIGDNTAILAYSCVTNITHEYGDINVPILKQSISIEETVIGKNCFIGMGARVLAGVHIGDGAVIGTNAVVLHDIPAHCVAVGIPAKVIKRYDENLQKWVKVNQEK